MTKNLSSDKGVIVWYVTLPEQNNEIYTSLEELTRLQEEDVERDYCWALAKVFDKEICIWTQVAINSLCIELIFLSNYCSKLIIPGSPTNWSNLYTSLEIVQGISVSQTDNLKSIVSFDLQLYSKCIQLQFHEDIKHQFIFFTLLVMLKVIGKDINQSELDGWSTCRN